MSWSERVLSIVIIVALGIIVGCQQQEIGAFRKKLDEERVVNTLQYLARQMERDKILEKWKFYERLELLSRGVSLSNYVFTVEYGWIPKS